MLHIFTDPEFGKVIVDRRKTTRRIIARWKQTELHISAPLFVGDIQIAGFIIRMRQRLRQMRPTQINNPYHYGYVFDAYRCRITLIEQNSHPNHVLLKRVDDQNFTIATHPDFNLNSPEGRKTIRINVLRQLATRAKEVLIPFAWSVCDEIGVRPKEFAVGRGVRRLGLCSDSGLITLSCVNLLYPEEIIRYIIIHELAHLTHLNHSPAFHALVDRYTGGREAELEAKLRSFNLPIDR